jgi:HSP20 family protein
MIVEDTKDFHVHVDLPGVTKEALTVEVDSAANTLVIRADRENVLEEDVDTIHRRERNYGKVSRTIPIPQGADSEHAKTMFQNGVLTISFPKMAKGTNPNAPRKLEIQEAKSTSG